MMAACCGSRRWVATMADYIYLDIETGRTQQEMDVSDLQAPPAHADELIGSEPASYKSDAAKQKWREERLNKLYAEHHAAVDERYARTSLEPLHGWTICIGLAVDDAEPVVLWCDSERDTLELLQRGLLKYPGAEIVAYNGMSFDFRWLAVRALHHGLDSLSARVLPRKRWGTRGLVDPYQAWEAGGYRARGRLPEVAGFLGYPVTDTVSGADIHDLFVQGEHDAITGHVLEDVRMLRHVHRRMVDAGWL
jgi:DNA polymerase elongation subunit (family B)